MRKWTMLLAAMLLAVTLALPAMAAAEDDMSFDDVGGTYWAKDAIDSLVRLGVVKGFDDHTFKPGDSVTREQFAQLITLAFYLDLPTDGSQTFTDVSTTRWSYSAVEAAKDFMTGYYPPNGKAFFDPTGKATREDVAVALVKTLGYTPDELENPDALNYFYDANEISPNLRNYVALAVEKKLLTGYEDGRIKPGNPVTRAEAAALIYRVIKNAAGDSQAELSLNVNAPETTGSPTFYITGDVTPGANVTINSKEAEVAQGQFRVAVQLQEEGMYTYVVSARMPGGKTQTVTKKVTFEKGGPTLEVTGVPEVTDKQTVTVSWTVKDPNDYSPVVYVNGEKQSYSSSTTIELEEGDNIIVVRADNNAGKSTVVTKHVVFQTSGPKLTVDDLPAETDKDSATITWTVQDKNDYSPKVYVNDELQSSYSNSAVVQLIQGVNTITVKAVNSLGKSTSVTKQIAFASSGPSLTLGAVPTTTTKRSVTLTWQVSDKNDVSPKVYVNDEDQSSYSNSATLQLNPGTNTIKVSASNKLGQTSEQTFNIVFDPPAPVLTLDYAPETTQSANITLSWTIADENDPSPNVYVNDQLVSSYSSSMNLQLVPGANSFKVVASNSFGKSTELNYTVTYTAPSEGE